MSTTLSRNRNLTTFTAAVNLFWMGEKNMSSSVFAWVLGKSFLISDIASTFDKIDVIRDSKTRMWCLNAQKHNKTLQKSVSSQGWPLCYCSPLNVEHFCPCQVEEDHRHNVWRQTSCRVWLWRGDCFFLKTLLKDNLKQPSWSCRTLMVTVSLSLGM